MTSMHLICGRGDGVSLNNLTYDKAKKLFWSGQWDIQESEAEALIGGWIYLHASKSGLSEFGGVVQGFEPVTDHTLARPHRVILIVQKHPGGNRAEVAGENPRHGP